MFRKHHLKINCDSDEFSDSQSPFPEDLYKKTLLETLINQGDSKKEATDKINTLSAEQIRAYLITFQSEPAPGYELTKRRLRSVSLKNLHQEIQKKRHTETENQSIYKFFQTINPLDTPKSMNTDRFPASSPFCSDLEEINDEIEIDDKVKINLPLLMRKS